jgi:hypothetical protein
MDVWGFACLIVGPVLASSSERGQRGRPCSAPWQVPWRPRTRELEHRFLPSGAVVGASAGTVVFGLLGLGWRPATPLAPHLKTLALVTAVIGALVVLGVHIAADHTCYGPWMYHRPTSDYFRTPHPGGACVPDFGVRGQVLLAFDAAFVASLSLLQALLSRTGRSSVGSGMASSPGRPTPTGLRPP